MADEDINQDGIMDIISEASGEAKDFQETIQDGMQGLAKSKGLDGITQIMQTLVSQSKISWSPQNSPIRILMSAGDASMTPRTVLAQRSALISSWFASSWGGRDSARSVAASARPVASIPWRRW